MKNKKKKEKNKESNHFLTSGTTEALLDIDKALSNLRRKIREA